MNHLLEPIHGFLGSSTPAAWINEAARSDELHALLIDHLHCELKAAQSAAFLLRKYVLTKEQASQVLEWLVPFEDVAYRKANHDLIAAQKEIPRIRKTEEQKRNWQGRMVDRMLLLMKEELHHFTQVYEIMREREMDIQPLSASRYAASLLSHVRTYEPETLIDKLIVGGLIEARSCERFAALAPHLDSQLQKFYISLLRSEARHFEDYLKLAQEIAGRDISADIQRLVDVEAGLITSTDNELRFHSGVPA
ncbi:tRNA-(ms[2]io[6]A)-hydroxylase [Lysobacter sp. N42]|nr:tRNA isopentenyl-2-thiomethyl-A-37 hydroxylase MiaE [Aliidiomarina sp. B3213]RTE87777.1 tRNA-(ms[2]io[6]A)-hydroxylase [Aliidiomarina sp. B3213]TCZ93453.1 tRNA-(ms[2]io[6]A)-hydroxylase [Lysobacter sp. N42]